MSKEEKVSFCSERIKNFRSSGKTCKDWHEEHQTSASTMSYWIWKMIREGECINDGIPIFASIPFKSEVAIQNTAENSVAVSVYISGYIRILVIMKGNITQRKDDKTYELYYIK